MYHGSKDCLPSELEEGKLVVGGVSVALIAIQYDLWHHVGICRRLLVLPDTSMYSTFS